MGRSQTLKCERLRQPAFQGAGVKTVVLFFDKGTKTRKVWYYQLDPGRNLGKTNPLNEDDLVEFVKLQKTFADSPKSWSMDAKSIDPSTFDLSVKNPNGGEEITHRSPEEIMDEIAALEELKKSLLDRAFTGQLPLSLGFRMSNVVKEKSFAFAIRIVNLHRFLSGEKREFVLSKQLLRSGTAIGALVREAEQAESKLDFVHKMAIALKEANETEYWILLLRETEYLSLKESESILGDTTELLKLLTSIIKTARNN